MNLVNLWTGSTLRTKTIIIIIAKLADNKLTKIALCFFHSKVTL